MRFVRCPALVVGLALLAGVARSDNLTGYKIQSIVKLGETVGDLKIRSNGDFEFGAFNDSGQIALVTENAAGGEMLLEFSSGTFIPIVVGVRDAPGRKWSRSVGIASPVQMNQQGDVVFAVDSTTYLWDHRSGQVSIVAATRMPAVNDLTFTNGADSTTAAINDYGEIAFQATVKDSAGKVEAAIFFLGRDTKLVPVLLAGQAVPGVGTLQPAETRQLTLNNAGMIGFNARRPGDKENSAFVWANGTITPVALNGADAPGGGTFVLIGPVFVNSKNGNVAVAANLDGIGTHWLLHADRRPSGTWALPPPGSQRSIAGLDSVGPFGTSTLGSSDRAARDHPYGGLAPGLAGRIAMWGPGGTNGSSPAIHRWARVGHGAIPRGNAGHIQSRASSETG